MRYEKLMYSHNYEKQKHPCCRLKSKSLNIVDLNQTIKIYDQRIREHFLKKILGTSTIYRPMSPSS